jgi:hypothetical protein
LTMFENSGRHSEARFQFVLRLEGSHAMHPDLPLGQDD